MKAKLFSFAAWCAAHPQEIGLLIVAALLIASAVIPGRVAIAGDIPGGGHPYP